ncbi:VF530 family protein [Pseudomonas citronellolis]|uniref:VF530 family protein n=1 Tax=Pseudomonas citronellolis TaxID=53408 RepID=UPI0023E41F94|nr:VF530 family protein [Pseudomonas citronellolis]MDF3933471.1 VF530 family protein [Pseudomonas citronellolis]
MSEKPKDPLHGMTLQAILESLLERYGWDGLAKRVDIRCFKSDPSIKSSLTFLRRTPWAREQVEQLYVQLVRERG